MFIYSTALDDVEPEINLAGWSVTVDVLDIQ